MHRLLGTLPEFSLQPSAFPEESTMSTTVSLPPTERDFRIYERVVLGGISTRQAAGEFYLSQTRIRQVVQRVSGWLNENVPAQDEATDAAHLCYARHVAADRLEYFYQETMHCWRLERQPKYLGLAIRITTAQARLPVIPGTLDALAAEAIHGPLPDDAPPAEDCSPLSPTAPATTEQPATPPTATPSADKPSDNRPPTTRAARSAFLSPAHPPINIADDSPVTEIKITPETLGLSTKKVLSRKERRRLRRLAKAK